MTTVMRTLVAGVGHHDLCDGSLGPHLARNLQAEPWPEAIVVEDLSYGPIHVVHRLNEEEPPFRRWVVVGAVRRGRPAGTVVAYRWDRQLPELEEIQARVGEAVTGVVGLDNLLIVTTALGAAPPANVVVEVEPELEAMGDAFSAPVRRALPQAAALVRAAALDGHAANALPEAPLGGPVCAPGAGAWHQDLPISER